VTTLQGAIVGLEMDADTARHHIERIQEHLTRADYHVNQARKLILDLKERAGWKVLGYKSWRECVTEEFQKSSSTVYRQLDAALVELELSPNGGIGEINERVLRPLTKRQYSAESRQLIWDISRDIVGPDGKITSGVIESVVEGIGDWLKSGTAQDGNGTQHPITELLRADLTARVREVRLAHKDHIQRMGKQRDYILGGVQVEKITRGQLDAGMVAALLPVEGITKDKLIEALRLGKPIFAALWTED
jgi:hypothetical protein